MVVNLNSLEDSSLNNTSINDGKREQLVYTDQQRPGYSGKDTQELQRDFDNDEEYESRKGIASYV